MTEITDHLNPEIRHPRSGKSTGLTPRPSRRQPDHPRRIDDRAPRTLPVPQVSLLAPSPGILVPTSGQWCSSGGEDHEFIRPDPQRRFSSSSTTPAVHNHDRWCSTTSPLGLQGPSGQAEKTRDLGQRADRTWSS